MADAEQFSLRWNNFHNNLAAGFHDLLAGEDLVDVTLAADGKFVQAHKMVLSVCSPYFKELFKVNPCKHPIVILKDIGYKELESLLQFMYRGEVNVRQEELTTFLKTAEMLQIKGLTGNDTAKETDAVQTKVPSTQKMPHVRTHIPQDTSSHPPAKRKRSDVSGVPSTSTPNPSQQPSESAPQSPNESSNDQPTAEENDFLHIMNPKMEPVEYNESEDGLEFAAHTDDANVSDSLVHLLSVGESSHKGGSSAMAVFPSLSGSTKDGNATQDSGQGSCLTAPGEFNFLIHQGFYFHLNKTRGPRSYWTCSERRRTLCRSRCVTNGSSVSQTGDFHNHDKLSALEGTLFQWKQKKNS